MTPAGYVLAARVPHTVPLGEFGFWTIERRLADGRPFSATEKAMTTEQVGFPDYVLLRHQTSATIHLVGGGEVVMEDSVIELSKHLPIWMASHGDVLVTGLGLGCVVRGLLANPFVDRVFVIEKDHHIVELIGREFWGDPRVTIHLGDAMTWEPGGRTFDFAWHDLWKEGDGLQRMHAKLMLRLRRNVGQQGAWAFPRWGARLLNRMHGIQVLGAPR